MTAARRIELRLYEELNDYLPAELKRRSFSRDIEGTPSVSDVLAALGVPRDEVDMVLVGDEPVPFSHRLQGGERIAVFPVFERFDISPLNRLRKRPLRATRFVLDGGLGKLARLLRLAGFDCSHDEQASDLDIVAVSSEEHRIILSRDPLLLRSGRITHGYLVQSDNAPAQFREIVGAFDLGSSLEPLSRCPSCNGKLRAVDDSEIVELVPFSVLVAFDDFWRCARCEEIYWKGSHFRQLARLLDTV